MLVGVSRALKGGPVLAANLVCGVAAGLGIMREEYGRWMGLHLLGPMQMTVAVTAKAN